jgi:hypothetical protein
MLFIFFGLAWLGAALLGVALLLLCQYIFRPTPKPKPGPDERRWTRDWESIERELNK